MRFWRRKKEIGVKTMTGRWESKDAQGRDNARWNWTEGGGIKKL